MTPSDEEFLKTLLATFKVEAEEHIAAISSGLVKMEGALSGEPAKELVESIFREAHSLKGAARSVNLNKLESICQSLEAAFAQIKNGSVAPSTSLFDRLHQMLQSAAKEVDLSAPGSGGKPISTAIPAAPSPAVESPPEASPPPAAAASDRPFLPDSVRVATHKLDTILRLAEDLIASRTAAAHRAATLRDLDSAVSHWEKDWNRIVRDLRRPGREGKPHPANGKRNGTTADSNDAEWPAFLQRNQQTVRSLQSEISALRDAMENDRRLLDRRVNDLLDGVKGMSMLPFSTLLSGFPKLVRDLCRDCGKDSELIIQGGEIEGSRRILDEIKDPLMHLVRNCVDHGIEPPEERVKLGKRIRARITISVTPKTGNKVELTVNDDGIGINISKVIAAAAKMGLSSSGDKQETDADRACTLVFQSGLSTSPLITSVSGHGLGLAIVREKIEHLGGAVAAESRPGVGTTFRLTLPLTLATFRGVLVRLGEELFVAPTMYVQRALRVDSDDIKSIENRPVFEFGGRSISVVWLAEVLGMPRTTNGDKRKWSGLLLGTGGERILFLVDEVLHDMEILVKSLGKQLRHVRNISGAGVLGGGRLAPVLNVDELMRSAAVMTPAGVSPKAALEPKSILIAEDSITSRTLLRGVLESSGYTVATAVNGADAFALLQDQNFDLVVSDIEMPRMTGLELTAKIRADERLADLPVVLVTGLDSREDRERGAEVGANAYIVKSSFDQSNLLEVIQRLI
jgi:two-component system chemotaxis sensor kinase CheA